MRAAPVHSPERGRAPPGIKSHGRANGASIPVSSLWHGGDGSGTPVGTNPPWAPSPAHSGGTRRRGRRVRRVRGRGRGVAMGAWQPLPADLPPEVRHFVEQLRLLKDRTGLSL